MQNCELFTNIILSQQIDKKMSVIYNAIIDF